MTSNADNAPETSNRVDTFGKLASGLCAIHCGLAAFLPGLFTVIGLDMLIGHEAEWGFTLVAIAFALGAMLLGWQRHRTPLIAGLFAVGILGLLASRFLEEMGEHGEHGQETEHAEKGEHGNQEEHGEDEEHGDHHGFGLGIVVGLGSGALLVFSHFKNAAAIRDCEVDCCDTPS